MSGSPSSLWAYLERSLRCVSAECLACNVPSHSVVSDSLQPRGLAHQAPLSMGFSGQEYWSGLPFPSPGDLPDSGIEPVSLASPTLADGCFTTVPPGTPLGI